MRNKQNMLSKENLENEPKRSIGCRDWKSMKLKCKNVFSVSDAKNINFYKTNKVKDWRSQVSNWKKTSVARLGSIEFTLQMLKSFGYFDSTLILLAVSQKTRMLTLLEVTFLVLWVHHILKFQTNWKIEIKF